MDNLTPEQRKKNMRNIKSHDSLPEKILRTALWKRGYRYRKNVRKIIGKPDICFIGKKIAVFCDSDFWHGRFFLEGKCIPQTNVNYWTKKLQRNIERDKEVNEELQTKGWKVLRFWESEIKKNVDYCVNDIIKVINKQ